MSERPTFSVEPARIDDLPSIVACDDLSQSDPSRLRSIEVWTKRGECLAARHNGSLVGFVVLEYGFFGHGFIPLLCVKRTERRQGFGLQLLAAAENACHTGKLFTSANSSNVAARSLFERAGFVPSGTIENLDVDDPELVYFKRRAPG
jgi:ribosomal protein S18 acetylase RimI-like enzyme